MQISSSNGVLSIAPLSFTNPTGAAQQTGAGSSATMPAVTTDVSNAGNFFSQLSQLQQNDPAKFKQTMSDIANQLNSAASNTKGNQASFLSTLANKFQTASQTGDVSSLKPPANDYNQDTLASSLNSTSGATPAHHHHGHHHKVQSQGDASQAQNNPQSQSSSSQSTGGSADIQQLFQNISNDVTAALKTS